MGYTNSPDEDKTDLPETKANAGEEKHSVVSVVAAILIIVGVVSLLIYVSNSSSSNGTSTNNNSGNQDYYLAQGNFSASFPSQPTYSTSSQELTANNNVVDNDYSWGSSDGFWQSELEAAYIASPFPNSALTPQENLESEVQYTSNNSAFNLISSTSTTLDGFPAIAYVIQSKSNPAAYDVGKDILTNNGLYMLGYFYDGQENQGIEDNFINSLTFGDAQNAIPLQATSPSQQQNTQSPSQQPQSTSPSGLTQSLINQIEPAIVEINCYAADNSVVVSGSGTSNYNDGTLYITTNYHVYNEANTGSGAPTCYAVYPEPPDFTYNAEYGDYQLVLVGYHYDTSNYEDEAEFTLSTPYAGSQTLNPTPAINNLPLTGMGAVGCPDAQVGDSVTVFGYPSSGNALGISETVTQGTIAGILPGPIYKFDGAIDHGNSGGLAVLNKDSCVLGIPTLGDSGLTAGIGYIQSFVLASQPVTLSNAQICQNNYGPYSVWDGQTNSSGGPTCDCESGYTWNAADTECVAMTDNQICERDVGEGSYYLGYDNPNGTLACSSPY
jgi:hypothetical protein